MAAPPTRRPSRLAVEVERWRFLLFGRVVPGGLFAFLGYLQLQAVLDDVRSLTGLASLLRTVVDGLYLAFILLPVGIYIVRPRPQARDGRIVARIAAFVGTLILLAVPRLPGDFLYTPPEALLAAATVALLGAYGLAVWGLLYLRKSFSIIPEARRVVSGGPYRVIRHPLYTAEIVAGLCATLRSPRPLALLGFAAFVGAQLLRAVFEERLLERTFPEYAEYRRRTWRMIPFLM